MAVDQDELLAKLHGRQIMLSHGTVTLNTQDAIVQSADMWWGDQVLSALANPNVAFLLLIFGFYGILFELYTPGWGVGGTLGIVCLILAFFGLSVLPINYVGLLLIAVALGMFVSEVFVTSFGSLTVGGVICLVAGGLMLVDSPVGFARVSASVVLPVAAATACIAVLLVTAIVKAHRRKALTGGEGLIGLCAVPVGAFESSDGCFSGTIRVHGEFWKAISPRQVSAESQVRIDSRDGLLLHVTPEPTPQPATAESTT